MEDRESQNDFATLEDKVLELLEIPNIGAVLRLNREAVDRAFEAYVFSLIFNAIGGDGGISKICGIRTGENPKEIVFRGGASPIGSKTDDFAYAACTLDGQDFEIHLDVKYKGKSGATHEIDVSLVSKEYAQSARESSNTIVTQASKHLFGVIECKHYDSRLGVSLGRTFFGLLADCTRPLFKAFVTNSEHQGLKTYLGYKHRAHLTEHLSPINPDRESAFIGFVQESLRNLTESM